MAETKAHIPRSFFVLLILVMFCGGLVFALSLRYQQPFWSIQLAFVIVVAALSEFFSFELPNFTVVLAYPLAMSAVVLGGPVASGLVAAASAVTVSDIRRRRPLSIIAFNLFSLVLVSCLAGWTYVLLNGHVLAMSTGSLDTLTIEHFPVTLIAMAGCAAVSALGNLVLTSMGISLYQGLRFRTIFISGIPFVSTQLALPFVGLLMAQVMAIHVLTLPLFVFPLAVAQKFYQRSTNLREAYADTVRSLVGALEAKDPYTRGHSERVADYALELGRALGFDDAAMQRVEYAALLHDLGKLAVPGIVLTKPDRLTKPETDLIREHPARGAAMVARIPPLKDLANYVGTHHERYGGGGYPGSISAAEIPQIARMLSIADSYDAMTTTRAYRPAMGRGAAIAELERGAGTQFDPELVRIFINTRIGTDDHAAHVLAGDGPFLSASVKVVQA